MMQAADFIICKAGGLIVSEALATGLPLLLVEALPGQEIGNAEHVIRGQAGSLVNDALQGLVTVFHWLDGGGAELRERAVCAGRLGKPKAALRVAELAWEAALQGSRRPERRIGRQVPLLRDLLKGFDGG
jgi:1,2-diacylglycerol 3-beta-galactosyltransferase